MQLLPSSSVLDRLARSVLLFTIFILPFAVVPASWLGLSATKMAIVGFGATIATIAWVLARFRDKAVTMPDTPILRTLGLVVIGSFVSALLSTNVLQALVGFGYERDTVFALTLFVMLCAGVVLTTRSVADYMRLQRALLTGFGVVAAFQIARVVIGADVLLPGWFSSSVTASVLGSWSDVAVMSGLAALTALIALALFSARRVRVSMYALLGASLVLLVLANVSLVWTVLALMVFGIAVYIFADASYDRESGLFVVTMPLKRLFPSLAVLVISLTFLVFGNSLGAWVSNTFGTSYSDVRPSWSGTIEVGKGVYGDNLLFGVGPSNFAQAWTTYRSAAVNQTIFWDTDFSYGIGYIPTVFINGGLVTGALWALFLLAFAHLGLHVFRRRLVQPAVMYSTVSAYLGALYLWIIAIVYVPQTTVLAYAFILTGAAIATAHSAGIIRTRENRFETSYESGLVLTGSLVAALIVSTGVLATHVERVYTSMRINHMVAVANGGDLSAAQAIGEGAPGLISDVRVHQLLTSIGIAQVNTILNEESDDVEGQRAQFQDALARTLTASRAVVAQQPYNYQAWLQLGDIYSQLVPLQVEGAYESAVAAYQEVQARNTRSPLPFIRVAQLALQQEDYEGAQQLAEQALQLKPDYTDAYYLLSQIAIAQSKTAEAITATESAVLLQPDNAGLLFQLGILHYSQQDFAKVVPVLERAVLISPDYSNALYFLGLAYDQTGNAQGALGVFTRVASLNPDNEQVKAIVVALESGQSALSALQPNVPNVATDPQLPVESSPQQEQ